MPCVNGKFDTDTDGVPEIPTTVTGFDKIVDNGDDADTPIVVGNDV